MILECGCDEVGRGSAIAEIYAAAVILDPRAPISGLADSKQLSAKRREFLAGEIKKHALSWSIGQASLEEVEQLNVHYASLMAIKRAVEGLSIKPHKALIDGKYAPVLAMATEAIIKGDMKIPAISAASILAKVARDYTMLEYHARYPEYGFNVHMGYLTKKHLAALYKYGPCPLHRKTFKPICDLLGFVLQA